MANRFDILWSRVKEEFPNAEIIPRDQSTLMKVLFWILRYVFFQKKNYNSTFTTTVMQRMYVPVSFHYKSADERYRTLRHELKHMRQFRYWPFPFLGKIPVLRYLNALIFGICYAAVLPVKLTLRAKFEREGYAQTLLTGVELGWIDPKDPRHVERWAKWLEETFTTGTYFYMARKGRGDSFARETLDAIAHGKIVNDRDRVDLTTTS